MNEKIVQNEIQSNNDSGTNINQPQGNQNMQQQQGGYDPNYNPNNQQMQGGNNQNNQQMQGGNNQNNQQQQGGYNQNNQQMQGGYNQNNPQMQGGYGQNMQNMQGGYGQNMSFETVNYKTPLERANFVYIKQKVELLEVFTACETKNRYDIFIKNADGSYLYLFKAKEDSGFCARQCCV